MVCILLVYAFVNIISLFIVLMDSRKEHENHQPSCAFVKLQKQDLDLWTIAELFNLIKVYNIKEIVSLMHFRMQIIDGTYCDRIFLINKMRA